MWALATTALTGAVLATSCSYYPYHCENYSECEGGDGDVCPGQCLPLAPVDFSGPMLLWVGREVDSPGCPDHAPQKLYLGHGGLDTSNECPACLCAPAECVLPPGITARSSAGCSGLPIPFNAPDDWDGTCTSPSTIPPGQLGSVMLAPVTLLPCHPVDEVPTSSSGTWSQLAYACAGEAIPNACSNPGETCMPTAEPPPPGFRQCVVYNRDGDPQCPATYPEKHVFYGGVDDTRNCTPCECTETVASNCSALVLGYEDTNCGTQITSGMVADVPICNDVSPGVALGSISASWIDHEPGSCVASGGAPVGEVKPLDARAFCCQPPPG